MKRFARECSSDVPSSPISLAPPFSNFGFLDQNFCEVAPLRRIFSQVRMRGAQTLVVEPLNPAQAEDMSEENDDIRIRFGVQPTTSISRLSFFTSALGEGKKIEDVPNEEFLGYAIVKQDRLPDGSSVDRVYESVIDSSDDSFVRGKQSWRCRVRSREFQVNGYLYAQQNRGWTNVCAHVACRTVAARFHPAGDMTYREMNRLSELSIDHINRTASDGLSKDQIIAILEAAGASCKPINYTEFIVGNDTAPFQKYVYGSVESGYPAILFFKTQNEYHAIPVFGHTFNSDMWVPNAENGYFQIGETVYIPSEEWLSCFVVHDDNWGSNYSIPRHFLYTRRNCEKLPVGPQLCQTEPECVRHVISTLPKEVKVGPIEAEVMGVWYLSEMLKKEDLSSLDMPWVRRLKGYADNHKLVLRPILITTGQYADHLSSIT
jgi:hypothetical protein